MKARLLTSFLACVLSTSPSLHADDMPLEGLEPTNSDGSPIEAMAKEDEQVLAGNVEPKPLPLDELRKFADVFGKIKEGYVEEIDDKTLLNYAIKGMLNGLDPHSTYLEPSEFTDLRETTSGSFGGLGMEVGMENGFVKVVAPIDDTPAQKGGIEAGDLIIELDNKPVKGMSLNQAVDMMRGEVGTKIKLKVVRTGKREPMDLTLTRAEIKTPSVRGLAFENKYAYLRIAQFQGNTGEQFAEKLAQLKADMAQLHGVIIDLRNNPGGVLQAAVAVADELLEEGLIVYTKGRSKIAELSFSAEPGDSTNGAPVIVLIDGGSASASEILAGALQDHERAVIMGTQSFGKGSVQNVLPLDQDHALKLTTARYYTPSGRSIQAEGIVPDIEVNRAKLGDEQTQDFFREADLTGHLSNDSRDGRNRSKEEIDEKDKARMERLEKDFQLQEALNLLKAIDILKIDTKSSHGA